MNIGRTRLFNIFVACILVSCYKSFLFFDFQFSLIKKYINSNVSSLVFQTKVVTKVDREHLFELKTCPSKMCIDWFAC